MRCTPIREPRPEDWRRADELPGELRKAIEALTGRVAALGRQLDARADYEQEQRDIREPQ